MTLTGVTWHGEPLLRAQSQLMLICEKIFQEMDCRM